jgi:hypothetical protein
MERLRPRFTLRRLALVPLAYAAVLGLFRAVGASPSEAAIVSAISGTGLAGIVLSARTAGEAGRALASVAFGVVTGALCPVYHDVVFTCLAGAAFGLVLYRFWPPVPPLVVTGTPPRQDKAHNVD